MATPSDSLFVPAATPKREHDDRRYDQLARANGWTKEELRKCGDLPKKKLPHGIKLVKLPSDVLEDPFKNAPHKDEDQEYNALEKRFYERLRNVEMTGKTNSENSDKPAPSISQKTTKSTKSAAHKKSKSED